MRKAILASVAASVVMGGPLSNARADVILTGNDLAGLTYVTNGSNTASYGAGVVTLVTTGGGQFSDTGTVVIPNGYLGVSLGATLSDLLSSGAAGHVSFDLASNTNTASGQYAYWNVELTNPSNTSQHIQINAFGDNHLGTNLFNQGASTNTSCWQGAANGCLFGTWGSGATASVLAWSVDSI